MNDIHWLGDYIKAQRARRFLRDGLSAAFRRVDCLLAPTLPIPAPALGTTEVRLANRTENLRVALTMFTRLFNLTGSPVVSLPCGFTPSGLPLSIQFIGRAFDEATILRIAHAYEQVTPWHQRRPPEM